ncbi:hypothetical protein [Kibdelosporangium philippinense]
MCAGCRARPSESGNHFSRLADENGLVRAEVGLQRDLQLTRLRGDDIVTS